MDLGGWSGHKVERVEIGDSFGGSYRRILEGALERR